MKRITSFAVVFAVSFSASAWAQKPATPASDAARQEAVIESAIHDYQQGIEKLIKDSMSTQPVAGELRELRVEDAVAMALEKNLDIQVAKLEPQSVDFQVAGIRNTYLPVLNSTLGMRDQFQLPTSTLNGGQRVNNGTRT